MSDATADSQKAAFLTREAAMQEIFDKAYQRFTPSDDGEAVLLYLADRLHTRFGYKLKVGKIEQSEFCVPHEAMIDE